MLRLVLVPALATMVACAKAPRDIVAGTDACDFCRMTISDTRFGGEIETARGRLVVFDAIECLASYHIDATARDDVRRTWVADFLTSRMIPADSAVFVEGAIGSPMGRSLVAFASRTEAEAHREGGRLLGWNDILASMRVRQLTPGAHTQDTLAAR
jgi:copper chaperone NosL